MAAPALFASILDFALPPRCASCGAIQKEADSLCGSCWQKLSFLTGAGCALCNAPIAVAGQICAPCLAHPPQHDGVLAAVRYDDVTSGIAIRLKHGRRTGLARLMAKAMARAATDADALLIPVPLHRWRLWRRGFNQSVLLARGIAKQSGHIVRHDLLLRVKATPMLGGLGAAKRATALVGAMKVSAEARMHLRDRHIYLVDDVYTSGATANAAAKALKRAGAARVTVLCWARVFKDL
jgi:ComF family protein